MRYDHSGRLTETRGLPDASERAGLMVVARDRDEHELDSPHPSASSFDSSDNTAASPLSGAGQARLSPGLPRAPMQYQQHSPVGARVARPEGEDWSERGELGDDEVRLWLPSG